MTATRPKTQPLKPVEEEPSRSDSTLPTDEESLDEALEETFPASDPISPSAASRGEATPAAKKATTRK